MTEEKLFEIVANLDNAIEYLENIREWAFNQIDKLEEEK